MMDQSKNRIRNREMGAPLGLVGMHTKDSVKEASSLPVKHFDFSFEDNNLEENTLQDCRVGDSINVISCGVVDWGFLVFIDKCLRIVGSIYLSRDCCIYELLGFGSIYDLHLKCDIEVLHLC